MKISFNKKVVSLATMILMLTIAIPILSNAPTASASVSSTRSYVYIGVSPNVVGVGQQSLIVTWTQALPPDIGETVGAVAAPNGRAAWNNLMIVNIIKPDGTNDTQITMPRTDPVGATYASYVPQEVGTYSFQVYFPGEWKNSTQANTQAYFQPDWSDPTNLTVQQDPVANWNEPAVTIDYWTRPLNDANREWNVLAGNWLAGAGLNYPAGAAGGVTNNYVPGQAPESAHILWTTPYYAGGIMDERFGTEGYETSHYQGYNFGTPIILQGKLIYQYQDTAHAPRGWQAVDLYTGQKLYFSNDTIPSFGQLYNYESPNQHGGIPYLYRSVTTGAGTVWGSGNGTVWEMLDGYTFSHVAMIANVTSGGTAVYGLDGSILRYNLVNLGTTTAPNYYLQVWNSSAIPTELADTTGTLYWQWRPQGGGFGGGPALSYTMVHNGNNGFSLNKSIPLADLWSPRNAISNLTASIQVVRQDDQIIFGNAGVNNDLGVVQGWMVAYSLKPGQVGTQLWKTSFTPPSSAGNATVSLSGVYPEYNTLVFHDTSHLTWYGYSLSTGNLVWTSPSDEQFAYYGTGTNMYNGIFYSYGYGGEIHAYNLTTGTPLWVYKATSVGDESPYGGNYPIGIEIVSDGKIYCAGSEHSPTQPLYRGPNLRCINATDGTDIWNILFWGARMSPTESNIYEADGILVGLNYFDGEIYGFGRGPSATTVAAAPEATAFGSTVMLTGTVTDQSSSGRRNTNGVLDFSLKDTPAISDASMSAWMEYKFMQQAMPTNATGVPITLTAIDPNGNTIPIGTTTSDSSGNYAIPYNPQVPGTYHILASFAGSKAYGPSYATTYINVGKEQAATVTPTSLPVSIADTYFVPAIVGIIVAIAIVGAILALLLVRKRP
jgi:hypothetical protein